jgi:cobalamin biosynthesis protein CobD/CbiB
MWDAVDVTRLADCFAERTVRGMLTRMVGAWVLIGLPVIAARIWWSVPAAIAIFVVTLTTYVTLSVRYMHRHRPQH